MSPITREHPHFGYGGKVTDYLTEKPNHTNENPQIYPLPVNAWTNKKKWNISPGRSNGEWQEKERCTRSIKICFRSFCSQQELPKSVKYFTQLHRIIMYWAREKGFSANSFLVQHSKTKAYSATRGPRLEPSRRTWSNRDGQARAVELLSFIHTPKKSNRVSLVPTSGTKINAPAN